MSTPALEGKVAYGASAKIRLLVGIYFPICEKCCQVLQ
jgi:hypothetical protein